MAELTKLNFIQYLCEKELIKLGLQDNKDYINRLERELTNVDVQEIQDYVLKILKSGINSLIFKALFKNHSFVYPLFIAFKIFVEPL